jgi:4a-hydroxytetrahydrobiopterin dehydratase
MPAVTLSVASDPSASTLSHRALVAKRVRSKIEQLLRNKHGGRSIRRGSVRANIGCERRVCGKHRAADHHPDIDVRWRKVTLRFITHDAGHAVTVLDTRLAGECDALFASTQPSVVSPGP